MNPSATPWALELRGLHRHFEGTQVLRGVSLAVRPGERLAIIGPNGAGKSTLFNLISGRLAPSAGEVWLAGRRIDGLKPFQINRLGLARSFQITHIFDQLSVRENLRCSVLWSLGYRYTWLRFLVDLKDVNARVDALLQMVGLVDRQSDIAAHLSYAEQRALEIGITLGCGAPVVLLDEPTAGMNRAETARFVALIRQVSEGRTLLMVEHDMGVVFELADRVAVLVQGELIALDTPAVVRADPRVQEAYLGQLPAAPGSAHA